jgi:hypothetical protein
VAAKLVDKRTAPVLEKESMEVEDNEEFEDEKDI